MVWVVVVVKGYQVEGTMGEVMLKKVVEWVFSIGWFGLFLLCGWVHRCELMGHNSPSTGKGSWCSPAGIFCIKTSCWLLHP